jgi:hypothetical protein
VKRPAVALVDFPSSGFHPSRLKNFRPSRFPLPHPAMAPVREAKRRVIEPDASYREKEENGRKQSLEAQKV